MRALRFVGLVLAFLAVIPVGVGGVLALLKVAAIPEAHAVGMVAGGGGDNCSGKACSVASLTSSGTVTSSAAANTVALAIGNNTYLTLSSNGQFGPYIRYNSGSNFMEFYNASALDIQRARFQRYDLQTCQASWEGMTASDILAGANTGKVSRKCYCRSNGSNTFVWINEHNSPATRIGTATTCPDTDV